MNLTASLTLRRLQSKSKCKLTRLVRLKTDSRIDVGLVNRPRIFRGNFFNLHAARLRCHKNQLGSSPVKNDARYSSRSIAAVSSISRRLHLLALRAGLGA